MSFERDPRRGDGDNDPGGDDIHPRSGYDGESDDRRSRRVDRWEARRIDLFEKILGFPLIRSCSSPDEPYGNDDSHREREGHEHAQSMLWHGDHDDEKHGQSPERREIRGELAESVHEEAVRCGL